MPVFFKSSKNQPVKSTWLKSLMKDLVDFRASLQGHVFGADEGVCYGVSAMAVQAILLNQLPVFSERIHRMRTLYQDGINDDHKLHHIAKLNISNDTDIMAFLNGVELYHQPYCHEELFENESPLLHQDISLSAPYLLPDALAKPVSAGGLGGIIRERLFTGVYSEDELTDFFNLIQQTADKHSTENSALLLRNAEHAIAVEYNIHDKNWHLINTEQDEIVFTFDSTKALAREVKRSFKDSDQSIFSTSWYATHQHVEGARKTLTALALNPTWVAIHRETRAKAKYQDNLGGTWLAIAALEGDTSLISKLLDAHANPNAKLKKFGATPLWLAASRNRIDIAETLLTHPQCKVKINDVNTLGRTALLTATLSNYPEMVRILLAHGANPNKRLTGKGQNESWTALHIAADMGYDACVQELCQHPNTDRHLLTKDKKTALNLAQTKQHDHAFQIIQSTSTTVTRRQK